MLKAIASAIQLTFAFCLSLCVVVVIILFGTVRANKGDRNSHIYTNSTMRITCEWLCVYRVSRPSHIHHHTQKKQKDGKDRQVVFFVVVAHIECAEMLPFAIAFKCDRNFTNET